jgi:3-phosphoshikimate 1-carboxyvinyltransferase
MTALVVHPADKPLVGSVPVPSDKSIAHRALLLGALCNGKSRLREWAGGEDNESTRAALVAMGVEIEDEPREGGGRDVVVTGAGLFGLRAPARDLDCGNSGTTMRLLCGILAAQPFASTLVGDASLSGRPMMRVIGPLRMRGAHIEGKPHPRKPDDVTAPLRIAGLGDDEHLGAIEYELPVASAQVKSALLLSGLYAHGATVLREPTLSRDHTERMLHALGVPLRTVSTLVELDPAGWSGTMPGFDVRVPGDVSAAAFVVGAALMVAGSRVTVRRVGTNPTRTGLLDVLRDMRAPLVVEPQGDESGEPIGNLHVDGATSRVERAGLLAGEVVPRAIDEIPALCAIASRAPGTTIIRDAAELRVKESDRIDAMLDVLRSFGVACEGHPDGLDIEGTDAPLRAATIDSRGDHRVAMSAALLALVAAGPSRIENASCIATSFPRFVGTLRALGARIEVVD